MMKEVVNNIHSWDVIGGKSNDGLASPEETHLLRYLLTVPEHNQLKNLWIYANNLLHTVLNMVVNNIDAIDHTIAFFLYRDPILRDKINSSYALSQIIEVRKLLGCELLRENYSA